MRINPSNILWETPVRLRHSLGLFKGRLSPFLSHDYISESILVDRFDKWSIAQKQQYVFDLIKFNVEYSYNNIPFYRDYYSRFKYSPDELKSFTDIKKIPVINKKMLLEYPIEKRSLKVKGAIKCNTGGSSGQTLSFYKALNRMKSHETVHMHRIWAKLGYQISDLKLVLNGQNRVAENVDFCFKTNSLRLDVYKEFRESSVKLKKIARKVPIRYLHGYPSTLYELALYCEEQDQELRDALRKTLKGAFLGSEYPHPHFRELIESVFNIETVNWYGHTEGLVLAGERDMKFRYFPFPTYGYAEIGDAGHLIASSFYDLASPFIRYDTEDIISEPDEKNGFLLSFRITEGRSGEFIIDKNGKSLSLTALVFGRHHRLFDYCSHIQICQIQNGKAEVLYVPKVSGTNFDPQPLFDTSNCEVEFTFRELSSPIKTKSGKLNLLVSPEQITE